MSYFPSSRSSVGSDFSYGERREVVMQNEFTGGVFECCIDHLLIQFASQGKRSERLCLTSCEERRSVYGRQKVHFGSDRSDLIIPTAIKSYLVFDDHFSNDRFFQLTKIFVRSEEHTSELQSRGHLVCRLLLEK